jgi:preprotein translocase subunit SecG
MNLSRKQVFDFIHKAGRFIVTHRVSVFLAVFVVIVIIVGVWREHSDTIKAAKAADNTAISESVSDSDSENTSSQKEDTPKDKFSIGWSNAIIFVALAIGLVVIKKKKDLGTTDSDRKSKFEEE